MKHEQLKQIAEYMGYEAKINNVNSFNPIWTIGTSGVPSEPYNPLTNAEQSMEMLKMLLVREWQITYIKEKIEWELAGYVNRKLRICGGDSLEQAILNAAWEVARN